MRDRKLVSGGRRPGGRSTAAFAVALLALAAMSAVLAGCGSSSSDSAAPAFSSTDLAKTPTTDWITNGGSVSNDRYSALDEIDTSNVGGLEGIWHVHLKSGTATKYSGEAQPLAYKGVLYTVTGADDVFAVDAKTGETKWVHRANLDPKIGTVCCGWTNRGVAIGDGKVYVGQLDGKLVALDQSTGDVAWSTQVARWQEGYTITSAPLYYGGRVYIGASGGEYLIRGRVNAYDAKNGKQDWRFYTIPGPGQVGHDTWPASNDSWKRGGAPVWQTPAVDPKLGLLYFSTGNAAPDADGRKRAGDNLFASSIVALDAATGKYRWHFQEVHHDIWDYDATSPVVLFDVKVEGVLRHGIAEPGKTGWLYLLDRTNGKPLFGIAERPVPQDPAEHTSTTQPFPSNPAFAPHTVSPQALKQIQATVDASAAEGRGPKVVASPIFTPPAAPGSATIPAVAPGPQGGTNWPETSYNPKTQLFYVCAQAGASSYVYGENPPKSETAGTADFGSVPTATGFGANVGTFTAIAANGGRIAWQLKWPDSCYSGSVTTAGNLVFVGRNTGELQAYDATSGKRLWSFQTGAGANAPATVFQLDGKQVIAFYAGGNSLAGSAHGDDLWLFGLDGDLGPVAPGKTSAAQGHAGEQQTSSRTIQVQGGEFFFRLSSQSAPHGKVTFVFKNVGAIVHDFSINGKTTPLLQPGKSAKLTVTFPKAGKYGYLCTVTGHAAAGMKGVLTVQ
jgi:quinohemoprotein ethanol dehydrogenase